MEGRSKQAALFALRGRSCCHPRGLALQKLSDLLIGLELDRLAVAQASNELSIVDGPKPERGFFDPVPGAVAFDLLQECGDFDHGANMMGKCPFVNGLLPKCNGLPILGCSCHG